MKNLVKLFLSAVIIGAFATGPAYGTQPDQAADPNDFHSTEPYILYIIGAKDVSVCEQQKDTLGDPVYGNTVFVPLKGNNIKILLQSVPGKREGEMPPLQVIDPCTASLDGSPATVQIPKNAHGYQVYARPLGKLTNSQYMQVTPQFMTAKDESGNNLIYLGQLTQTGLETPYISLSRQGGQWTPQDITPLFEWSGNICSLSCNGVCTKTSVCCTFGTGGSKVGTCSSKTGAVCPAGTMELAAYCKTYTNEWLLNIAGFATYFSGMDNVQKIEIRFYPVK